MNCTFKDNSNTAIYTNSSNLFFQGFNIFQNNSAAIGGALRLAFPGTLVHLLPHTTLLFVDNHADYVGGAIYSESEKHDPCFYHIVSPETVKMVFINNTASLYFNLNNWMWVCQSATFILLWSLPLTWSWLQLVVIRITAVWLLILRICAKHPLQKGRMFL